MNGEKTAQYVCLTTLEYAMQGSLASTNCPSCGLRLIIKQDSLVNRVTSVSLLLGMSILIGYNFGAHGQSLRRLARHLLRTLGFGFGGDSGGRSGTCLIDGQNNNASLCNRSQRSPPHVMQSSQPYNIAKYCENNLQDNIEARSLSDSLTSDSAIDIGSGNDYDDTLDQQLMEMFEYNNWYNDYYYIAANHNSSNTTDANNLSINATVSAVTSTIGTKENDENDDYDDSQRGRFRTRTVDRIDQVLHQIDDIKKSIVEIDDELYHIAGSTYANFNPAFFSITNSIVDELDRDECDSSADEENLIPDAATHSVRPVIGNDPVSVRPSESIESHEKKQKFKSNKNRSSKQTSSNKQLANSRSMGESHSSRTSLSDMSDNLQLEWDFDFDSSYDTSYATDSQVQPEVFDAIESGENGAASVEANPLREKLSSATVASRLDIPMTDEQKLKSMHDLLDEAKKMGLLNNIINALAPPPPSPQRDDKSSQIG